MNLQFNIQNNNNDRYSDITKTSYIHLRPHVNLKPNLHGAGQRKLSHPYHKFQTGSTTTFSGYTNVIGYATKEMISYKEKTPKYNNNTHLKSSNYNSNNKLISNNNRIPSLMSIDCFQQPSRRNRRTIQHADQYRIKQIPLIQHQYKDSLSTASSLNNFKGLILSDSMCKYVRPEQVSPNGIQVSLSFESGCDCNRMLNFLEKQQIEKNNILQANFVLFSLCTNDVANIGPDRAIQHCRLVIQCTRQLFPHVKSIGWLALSPRWKPSKLYNSLDINQNNRKFNQLLYILSKEMHFDIIYANLQQQHMHHDGLHPSIKSGRSLIERALYNWFEKQQKKFNSSSLPLPNNNNYNNIIINDKNYNHRHIDTINNDKYKNNNNYNNNHQTTTINDNDYNHHHIDTINNDNYVYKNKNYNYNNNRKNHNHNHNNRKYNNYNHHIDTNNNDKYKNNNYNSNRKTSNYNGNQKNNNYNDNRKNDNNNNNNNHKYNNYNDNNDKKMKQDNSDRQYIIKQKLHNLPGKSLIINYPHFLRHKPEFLRKIKIPEEFENKKEDIFILSNMHFETEYLKTEAEKWKIYMAAVDKRNKLNEQIEPMEIIIEENNNSLPIARPSPTGLISPPAPLDFTDLADIFDEWLPAPTPGQKRKLGHRQDDPPTPPSPRQPPPPIVPRRTLPPRDPNKPLRGGSLCLSPIIENNNKQQHSFNSLLPIEKENQPHARILLTTNEPSMIISPIRNSTPEQKEKSPSVVPKNPIEQYSEFNFSIIPIECRYHFKKIRERCTFETIKIHQEFLENKYKILEDEREDKLHSSFPKQIWTKVVEFVKNIIEKPLENKMNNDKKRLDNLLLDQKRKKATLTIEEKGTPEEQQYIGKIHEKYMRKLSLQLQLDKLEKRFVENMPPPSLNIFDKLELHAKELKTDNQLFNSLREQWKNVLRKTKLDLTSLMRQAKIIEIEEANKQYKELELKLPEHLRESYDTIRHGVHNERKLVHALTRNHAGQTTAKLHKHFTRISFPPQANNKALIMNNTETRILNLGPKFVPPAPQQALERLPKEIKQMKEKITTVWKRATNTIEREPTIVNKFCQRIEDEIRKTITTEIPQDPTIEPTIRYFQKIQKQNKIIFRQTDKSKIFHTDNQENYIKKSALYMEKTNAYIEIQASPLKEMIETTDKFLRNLVSTKQMPQSLLDKLRPSRTESELPHLYYNPKDHKIGEPLRPIVSGIKSPLAKIASFLDKNIRPLFDKNTPYSISNSLILLRYLKQYKTTSETNLYTFDITDLYTMIPQREAVLAVCEFLGRHGYHKINNLSINTIKALFLHVLENSYFVLQLPGEQPKYYKQIRGGAMGSACTQVLADIYVRKWESSLVEEQYKQKELYFRFRDDVFLTTKLPSSKIDDILEELNKSDPNLKIQWEGGKSVDYLDVTINIETPNFRTKLYRKLAAQPYTLPYHSSHPKHIMRNIPYAAALRATRICSHPKDLHEELDRIRVTLLLNKYPPKFIDQQMKRFYKDLTNTESSDLLTGDDHKKYRDIVLDEQWNKKEKRKIDFRNDIICHFSYTPALARFGTTFHQVWKEIFEETPLDNTRIIYANRLTSNLKQLLVKKRPDKKALTL